MNPQKFHLFVQNYNSLLLEDVNQLIELEGHFPYSQVIRHLVARGAQDLNLPEKDQALRQSAIYATDRAVLKSVMTAPRVAHPMPIYKEVLIDLPSSSLENQSTRPITIEVEAQSFNTPTPSIDIYKEVEYDMEQLHKSMHRFEEVVDQLEHSAAHTLSATVATKAKTESQEADIIEQIKSIKQQIKSEDVKQSEQTEIIDHFIKIQPTINKLKPVSEPKDLT
ncbi:MAG: hypothetical protein ORN54_06155, partial [Cyclobacteriaceae bacterium]|nr:hypothetical protein [Cyclobacteriaceae bacterium]